LVGVEVGGGGLGVRDGSGELVGVDEEIGKGVAVSARVGVGEESG